jgi:hypothetical protein
MLNRHFSRHALRLSELRGFAYDIFPKAFRFIYEILTIHLRRFFEVFPRVL